MEYLPEDIAEKLAATLYNQAVASFTAHLNKHERMSDAMYLSSCNESLKNVVSDIEIIFKT